jgi:hypothetical protein
VSFVEVEYGMGSDGWVILGTTEEEEELYSTDGPLWYRGWALESDEKVCADVDEVLAKTGTRRMIMGHTLDLTVTQDST